MSLGNVLESFKVLKISTFIFEWLYKCKDHKIYSKMLRKIFKKKSNLNSIRVIKIQLLIKIFYILICLYTDIYGPNLSKNPLVTISCSRSERLLVSSATLSCKTWNILTLSMLVYFNENSFFSEKFLIYAMRGLFSSLIKVLSFMSITWFWSFIVSFCSLTLLLPNIASS